MLEASGLTISAGGKKIVDNVSFKLKQNEWLMIIGPNGAGKSTIISAISGGARFGGKVVVNGDDITTLSQNKIARRIGVLTQSHAVNYGFTVAEIVKLGRYAYSKGIFSSTTDEDDEKIETALKMTGLLDFCSRSVLTLSGGELQRTFLAQVLAQDPQILLLDEPTNHLDLVFQKQVFEILSGWVKTAGKSVVSVVHDLSLARAYGDTAILMTDGKAAAYDDIQTVFSSSSLNEVYNFDVAAWNKNLLQLW